MKAVGNAGHLASLGLIALLSACASAETSKVRPVEPWDQINAWLDSAPRDVAIRVDSDLPRHRIEVHESRALQGAGRGAGMGALGSLYGGASTADPLGLALGVVLMPVFALGGAVYGAVDAEPAVSYHPIDEVPGAKPLFQAASKSADFRELLSEQVGAALFLQERPDVSLAPSGHLATPQSVVDADVLIAVSLTRYDLFGDIEDDPSVRLMINGNTLVGAYELGVGYACPWSYQSERRSVSEWAENGAEHFQSEIRLAARKIAADVASAVQAGGEQCRSSTAYAQFHASRESCLLARREAERLDVAAQLRRAELCFAYGRPAVWRWRCLAAHQGDAEAQYDIAESYRAGRAPAETDPVRAYSWYILASTQGHRAAADALARLSMTLTTREIAEAGRRAATWTPNTAECEAAAAEEGTAPREATASAEAIPSQDDAFNAEWIILATATPASPASRRSYDGVWVLEVADAQAMHRRDRITTVVSDGRFSAAFETNGWTGDLEGVIDDRGVLSAHGTVNRVGGAWYRGTLEIKTPYREDGFRQRVQSKARTPGVFEVSLTPERTE